MTFGCGRAKVLRSTLARYGLAKIPDTHSAMTKSDNRRCPVQENTSRQKPERCSDETYHQRQPPSRTGPAALGQFVLEPFSLNSHLSTVKCSPKCVVINTGRPETQPQSDRTQPATTPPDTSQPARPVTCLKGCACVFKGEDPPVRLRVRSCVL